MGIVLKRSEAVALLKDIYDGCPFFDGMAISLIPPDSESVPSKGFQIHIKCSFCRDESIDCLEKIAEKHNVAIKQEDTVLIIYKPKDSNY